MMRAGFLILAVPCCFTLLVIWFAWSAFTAAPPIAAENLRGAGLSIAAGIEQLAAADSSFRSMSRYSTPDIAYFSLIDRRGHIRFHTNTVLIGTKSADPDSCMPATGLSEQRSRLGTGEEVYILKTPIHPGGEEYLLVLALHTYRADNVIRRARTGVAVVTALTACLWLLTVMQLVVMRRDERRTREMRQREELARLGEVGAIMAHEIRNPLAGIKGFAQMVESASDLDHAALYAGRIVSQSIRLETLVNDLLNYARYEQGERYPVDLNRLIGETLELMRPDAERQGVSLSFAAGRSVTATVVADRLEQLLLNLLKNGLQAMPDGGVLQVELIERRGLVEIYVTDSGVGIAQDKMQRIFEPFWTDKATGTGLGLALCRKIAEEHGGSIAVQSREGEGTTVTVSLPVSG